MVSLGISAFYHDSAAALVIDGKVVAAAQEERFSRIKHDPAFPSLAVAYCLKEANLSLDEVDAVVFYDKPLLKFERLLETYFHYAPRGIKSFMRAMPVWIKEKIFLKSLIRKELKKVGTYDRKKLNLLFAEHHLSHAASTFYPSPFEEAAILTIDGVGEWTTASIGRGSGNEIEILKELHFPHSLGLLYSSFTQFLGFKVNSGEYKVMGLAPYGEAGSAQVESFKEKIRNQLVEIKDDGSILLNLSFFSYATGDRMISLKKWESLFGIPARKAESELELPYANLALAIQQVTEEVVLKMAAEAKRLTGLENICLAGGVALNSVANGKLDQSELFKNVFITPASGDAGGALGAAYLGAFLQAGIPRKVSEGLDDLSGSYLGPSPIKEEIVALKSRFGAHFEFFDSEDDLVKAVSRALEDGMVVGWMQHRMEFGPRALGARSILADPRRTDMQQKLNLKIKFRESFRPFAPSVLDEKVEEYFQQSSPSPYMLLVKPVQDGIREPLPNGYPSLSIREKLAVNRSTLPAITHVDFSARFQTVHRETNPRYWKLIQQFGQQTGCPVLVNTSFNVRGEPIVCSPEDAYRCFMTTDMDVLSIGNYLFKKAEQPEWKESLVFLPD